MNQVAIVKCDEYDQQLVEKQMEALLNHLGGLKWFIKPGDKVVLKVNLLMKRKPERATTTHPLVVRAVAKKVLEIGATPIIADSPGGYNFWNEKTLKSIYKTTGMEAVANELNIDMNLSTDMVDVPYNEGKILKSIKTYKAILNADKIINLPKIKTHMMTVYSGAVKNLFGIIPGGYKGEYHFRFDDVMDFSNLLIDICQFAKPTLTIMDAIDGMEGYGPTAGRPKRIGLLIASSNPYQLDAVASKIIGLPAKKVPSIQASIKRNLYSGEFKDIEIQGENIKDILIKDYKIPTTKIALNMYHSMLPKFLGKFIDSLIKPYPVFNKDKCVSCEVCVKSCPAKCLEIKEGILVIDKSSCIRCFCCHELCNVEAIKIKRSPLISWILK